MKLVTMLGLIMSIMLLVSCRDSVNLIENQEKTMERNSVLYDKIITDSSVNKRLKVERIDRASLPTGLLKIQARIRNTSTKPFKFSYRFIWYNKTGMEVNTPASTWIEKDILGGDTTNLSAVSPNPQCADFELKLMALE